MSPILANIYLDVVLDQWFLKEFASNSNVIVRYADDAVFFFRNEDQAKSFMVALEERVIKFDLMLNKDKTHEICMGKNTHNSFSFLGITFYWGKQNKRIILKVSTQKEKMIRAINEFNIWIKQIRNSIKLPEIWKLAKSKIIGHINYYGYALNNLKINYFYNEAIKALFKWLNRRSQKRSYDWEGFNERIKNFPLMPSWENLKLKQLGYTYGY